MQGGGTRVFRSSQSCIRSSLFFTSKLTLSNALRELLYSDYGRRQLLLAIKELTSLVRQRATGQHHNRLLEQECGMCGSVGHLTNACLILYKIEPQRCKAPSFRQPQQQPVQQPESSSSLEEFMKQLTMSNIKFQEDICATQQDLQTQISELTTIANKLYSKRIGHSPSQTIPSPREENRSDITGRSSKELPQQ
ncbi:hypothetical protein CR513_02093, partial [Mucuna pruriens]